SSFRSPVKNSQGGNFIGHPGWVAGTGFSWFPIRSNSFVDKLHEAVEDFRGAVSCQSEKRNAVQDDGVWKGTPFDFYFGIKCGNRSRIILVPRFEYNRDAVLFRCRLADVDSHRARRNGPREPRTSEGSGSRLQLAARHLAFPCPRYGGVALPTNFDFPNPVRIPAARAPGYPADRT